VLSGCWRQHTPLTASPIRPVLCVLFTLRSCTIYFISTKWHSRLISTVLFVIYRTLFYYSTSLDVFRWWKFNTRRIKCFLHREHVYRMCFLLSIIYVYSIYHIFTITVPTDEFNAMLFLAENRTQSMLSSVYRLDQRDYRGLLSDLFLDMTAYLRSEPSDLTDSVAQFYNSFFPVVFQ